MAQDLTIDYLIVSRQQDPPPEVTLIRALSSANLGMAVHTPGGARSPTAPANRERLGTYVLGAPKLRAQARINVYRYLAPVTNGMGETAFATLTRGLSPADLTIVREGTLAYDLRLTCGEADVGQAVAWNAHVLRVVLDTIDAVVIDPAAQRCYGRTELARQPLHTPLAHIALHIEGWDAESRWVHTHGLQKFGRPELDLLDVPSALQEEALSFLRDAATSLARGATLVVGQEVHVDGASGLLALGTTSDLDHQAPYGRLRLADLAQPGERQGMGARRFLTTLALSDAERRATSGDQGVASDVIERLLTANPDDCAALSLKARLVLRAGQVDEALALGELMEVRAPSDFRGPLTMGLALLTMGRFAEALQALGRAIERAPDAAEPYALRADVHARTGQQQLAASDRSRAAYLRA